MTKSEEYIYKVEAYLRKRYGLNQASIDLYPLWWWVSTGRASAGYLSSLYTKKPYRIGQILHKGGSVQEAVDRIREYLEGRK